MRSTLLSLVVRIQSKNVAISINTNTLFQVAQQAASLRVVLQRPILTSLS